MAFDRTLKFRKGFWGCEGRVSILRDQEGKHKLSPSQCGKKGKKSRRKG